jgi:hypothetical protein
MSGLDNGSPAPKDEDAEFEDFVPPIASQDDLDYQAHQLAKTQNIGHQRVIFPEDCTRPEAIASLNNTIPQNEFQLPIFFYRSDLLPFDLSVVSQEDIDNALTTLDYVEGYPTYGPTQKIFWFQLPHEPFADYLLFQRYLEQPEETGLRLPDLLAQENSVSSNHVSQLMKEFYWRERARAYDLFQVAADRKRRQLRAIKLERDHDIKATQIVEALFDKLLTPDPDGNRALDQMSPEHIVTAIGQMTKLQRVSNGLPPNGTAIPLPSRANDAQATGEDLLRALTSTQNQNDQTLGISDSLAILMATDPSFILAAQDLIIKVRHGAQGSGPGKNGAAESEKPQGTGSSSHHAPTDDLGGADV